MQYVKKYSELDPSVDDMLIKNGFPVLAALTFCLTMGDLCASLLLMKSTMPRAVSCPDVLTSCQTSSKRYTASSMSVTPRP